MIGMRTRNHNCCSPPRPGFSTSVSQPVLPSNSFTMPNPLENSDDEFQNQMTALTPNTKRNVAQYLSKIQRPVRSKHLEEAMDKMETLVEEKIHTLTESMESIATKTSELEKKMMAMESEMERIMKIFLNRIEHGNQF
ncbi:hypothetical protein FGB62_22g913 [Gracilaria domingensis]|nr:hypothetical protein FGB62_22g913 [Gracilaria domingensis]